MPIWIMYMVLRLQVIHCGRKGVQNLLSGRAKEKSKSKIALFSVMRTPTTFVVV